MSRIEARFKGTLGRFALDVAFTCPATGVTGVFGPSGCGKTTILRCIAGLTRVKEGHLKIGDEVWQDAETFRRAHRRPIGYVFQEARLFPHMSVLGNLTYGMRRALVPETEITRDAVVDLLEIGHLLDRSPTTLSGGERQRVAIGRALLSQPRVLLMDEPLSALDHQSKRDILPYLQSLPRALSVPVLYVSHDIVEIEHLADHLILMTRDGRIQAAGRLDTLLTDLSLPLARMPDSATVITVTVEYYDAAYDISECRTDGRPFFVPGELGPKGSTRRLRIRASDVSLVKGEPRETSVLNVLPARIIAVQMGGAHQTLVLLALSGTVGTVQLLSSITRKSWEALNLAPGDSVFAQIKGMALADAG